MEIKITGLVELERKFKALEFTQQRSVLVAAAKAGGQIILDEARMRAPRDEGDLAEGMGMRLAGRESDIHEASVDVGPGKKQFYGIFQEFGTAHHAAQPFLTPALENKKEEAVAAAHDKLISAIKKVTGSGI